MPFHWAEAEWEKVQILPTLTKYSSSSMCVETNYKMEWLLVLDCYLLVIPSAVNEGCLYSCSAYHGTHTTVMYITVLGS